MITKNLMVGISENVAGGDMDAVLLKTTRDGGLLLEVAVPKVAVSIRDMEDAIIVLKDFISARPTIDSPLQGASIVASGTIEELITSIPMNFEFSKTEENK